MGFDLMMIPAKELCDIPVIYDPSHLDSYRNFVPAISKSAIAAGADGLILNHIQIHRNQLVMPTKQYHFQP